MARRCMQSLKERGIWKRKIEGSAKVKLKSRSLGTGSRRLVTCGVLTSCNIGIRMAGRKREERRDVGLIRNYTGQLGVVEVVEWSINGKSRAESEIQRDGKRFGQQLLWAGTAVHSPGEINDMISTKEPAHCRLQGASIQHLVAC